MAEIIGNSIDVKIERLVDESHRIAVDGSLAPQAAEFLKKANLGSRYAMITDSNAKEYAFALHAALKDVGIGAKVMIISAGEQNKTIDTYKKICNALAKNKYSRDSVLIGVGGGVVTDLTGLVASTYAREIPFVFYATTLLAQVDAAIGGKNGVDLDEGKNMVGRIQQPKAVFNDIDAIINDGFPDREFRNGLAEVVKYGIIADEPLFRYLQQNADAIMARDRKALMHIVKQSCRIKMTVVEQDPNEKGLRRILNYGHTLGHPLEKLAGYNSAEMPHGFAVAIGMPAAARIAIEMGFFSGGELLELVQLEEKFGLPFRFPEKYRNDDIFNATPIDKKSLNGCPRYALPEKMGKMVYFGGEYVTEVKKETVLKALDATR